MGATTILIGASASAPDYAFTQREIRGLFDIAAAVDPIGSELSEDTLTATVEAGYALQSLQSSDGYPLESSDGFRLFARGAAADLTQIPYATPVRVLEDGVLRHLYYFKNAVRTGKGVWRITAFSGVGLLDRQQHAGGMYTGQPVAQLLQEIVGDAFAYELDSAVATQEVYNWLPADTSRKNLHRLMFALGISIVRSDSGGVRFAFLSTSIDGTLPASRTFAGGSVNVNKPVSAVEVTEHSWYQTALDETVQLFDNVGAPAVSNLTVTFDGPVYNLTASSGLTVVSSDVNHAVVTGTGTLTGKKYTHNTHVVRLENPETVEENVLTSSDDTLVNAYNSRSVAQRLLAYYTSRQTVRLTAKLASERPGQRLNFTDPFGSAAVGFFAQAQIAVGGIRKAQMKLITGYVPTGQGNYYTNRKLVTASGTWTVPAGVSRIRIVLVGGGAGGQGGYNGHNGLNPLATQTGEEHEGWKQYYYTLSGAASQQSAKESSGYTKGGGAGAAGQAGKVYIAEIDVTPGTVITFSIGAGGAGGATNGGSGSAGAATTASGSGIGTLSSADGAVGTGYYDAAAQAVYGAPGSPGVPGGDGGFTDSIDLQGCSGASGLAGAAVGSNSGGTGGAGVSWHVTTSHIPIRGSGGAGGGAAYGANGAAGGAASVDQSYSLPWYTVYSGAGGDGANASAPPAPAAYGNGGNGGNGGGGGGNAGGYYVESYGYIVDAYDWTQGGRGGSGSAGGAGGAGCALVLY